MTEMENNLYCKIVPGTYFVLHTPSDFRGDKTDRKLSSEKEESMYLSHKFETELFNHNIPPKYSNGRLLR